jgi:phosphatidylglycerol:prolipoprotein diacylglycerol transferase
MFYWDPKPEILLIPYFNWPILWYSLLFMVGFSIGFPIFVSILRRYFLNHPQYIDSEILCLEKLTFWGKTKHTIVNALNHKIVREEFGNIPEKFRNFVNKSNCLHPKRALARLKLDLDLGDAVLGLYRHAILLTDRLVVYMLVATIFGARLGQFLFYEKPEDYLDDPWEFFRIWEGGLASHGAAIGIIIAVILFSYRIRKTSKGLTWIRVLDFVCVPTALCGCFIRIGNFFNQEILGSETSLPWGVVFGSPIDHSISVPRHPVQIYEAIFYLLVFCLLWRLTYRPRFLLTQGQLIGLFLILVFGFRFFIEFLKIEQSHLLPLAPLLTMGQILSVPMVFLGVVLYFKKIFTTK